MAAYMVKTKPQTFTMDSETIEKLNALAQSTGLKKSTLVTMLIKDCTTEKICNVMSAKVKC
jgi:predicted DNA-binding protein